MNSSEHKKMASSDSNFVEYLKFAGVLLLILLVTYLIGVGGTDYSTSDHLRNFMGVFMIVFSLFKFIGYKMFVMMFAGYDILAKRFKTYGFAYPFIELFLGIAALSNFAPIARNIAVILVMGIGAVGVVKEIYHKRSGIHCACLGNIIKLPLSTVSLVEDLGMVMLSLAMLVLL